MILKLKEICLEALSSNSECKKLDENEYTHMRWPGSFLPLMKFDVDRYNITNYGTVMVMHTTTKMGMELLTISLMPGEGALLPYLLIDAMSMKKKRCVFVEYYGCGYDGFKDQTLHNVYEKYKMLSDYQEKEAWYVSERMPYSLIKSGTVQELSDMTADSLRSYCALMNDAQCDAAYLEKLRAFRERMIVEGNPSSKTLEMLLNKDGAVRFMKDVVMPITDQFPAS